MKYAIRELNGLGDFAANAIENDTISFIAIHGDGHILTFNIAFCELTGYTKAEIGAMRWPDDFTPATQLVQLTELIEGLSCKRLQSPGLIHQYEEEIVKKNGLIVPVEIYVHKFCRADGSPQYYYAFITNISDRIRMEHDLIRSRDKLEAQVKERTIELSKANDALIAEVGEHKRTEAALRDAMGQADLYVDLMSHDLSNMNHAIMGYLELALETMGNGSEHNELLETPLEIIKNSSTLIENVKKMRKLLRHDIQIHANDLGAMLSEMQSQYSHMSSREISINYAPVQGCLVNSNGFLKDVFKNLIENAIKHSTGPLAINLSLTKTLEGELEYCNVVVEDTGPGIPDQLKETIFKLFNGDPWKTSRRGLGLHLVNTIVETLGGRIWVEDRVPGDYTKGARFTVVLPVANP